VNARPLLPPRRVLGFLLLAFAAACQDAPPTGPGMPLPQFDVSEARFGAGNPDFFFASPLAAMPSAGDAGFEVGAAHGALVPYVRICETDGASGPAGCTADVTAAVTGSPSGLAMRFDAGAELYQVNWSTSQLDESLDYRIEVWGVAFETDAERAELLALTFPADDPLLPGRPRWLFGWRDIANSPSVANCAGSEAFCLINYGRNVPVKVRIEDFVLCPVTRNCAVQFVAAGVDANLEAILGSGTSTAQLFIPGQPGTDFALGFEPCSPAETAAAKAFIAIPTFGPCLKTVTTGSSVTLSEAAVLSYCLDLDALDIESQLAVPASQHDRVGIHHFNTGGSPTGEILNVEAWPHVAPACGAPTSGGFASAESPKGLVQLAQAAGRQILSLFGPEPVVALDIGGGGEGFKFESFFMLGLPTKFEYEVAGDGFQRGIAGSAHTLRAKATDVDGNPVWGARVGWSVISSPGGDASVATSPVLTGIDGIAQTTVTLSSADGDNVFHATGLGIADDREIGCTLLGGPLGGASCNGPRATYDPFQPHAPALLGGVQVIPEGTRLPFTVYGCAPGRGTATPNGVLAAGEWDCALSKTFPVSLSGGSAQATLLWMNDDTRFYVAVRVPGSFRENALRIDWDNDGDAPVGTAEGGAYAATREPGDDVWELLPPSGAADRFIDVSCSGSSQAGCGSNDSAFGGAMQTVAGFDNTSGGFTVYEMSHPLTTTDACTNSDPRKGCGALLGGAIDLRSAEGDSRGFFVTLRNGSGAQGNTQWPGFLQYMRVVIK